MKSIIDAGALIDAHNDSGDTSLHIAAEKAPYAVLKVLIGNGAAAEVRNNHADTPVHLAARWALLRA